MIGFLILMEADVYRRGMDACRPGLDVSQPELPLATALRKPNLANPLGGGEELPTPAPLVVLTKKVWASFSGHLF